MAIRILLVEDSPTILNMLSIVFRQKGFEVMTAADGVEALELIDRGQLPEVVITDINMPRMDGMRLISALREREEFKNVPIIVLSTEGAQRDQREGLARGADLYLVKPVGPKVLVEAVNRLVEERSGKQ